MELILITINHQSNLIEKLMKALECEARLIEKEVDKWGPRELINAILGIFKLMVVL